MRKPTEPERLYLDFDGFFASCEQYANPKLRGRPVGVVPFAGVGTTCIIACSREAKAMGVSNVMTVREAQKICPEIILTPQNPDLYRRAHNALISEISMVIPVDAVKSIDELTCRLDKVQRKDPQSVGHKIKQRLEALVGPWIKCSLGYAANRQLAKMACKAGKPNGNCVWHPDDMPGPLLGLKLSDVPGIGRSMEKRLWKAHIWDMEALLRTQPKQLRGLWRNVTGERLWYALHGYNIQTPTSERGMYGHGRVLPPSHRSLELIRPFARILLTKAARRMRRDGYSASRLYLWLAGFDESWSGHLDMPCVCDDHAILNALESLMAGVLRGLRPEQRQDIRIVRLGVTLGELTPTKDRQLDLLIDDEPKRLKLEAVTHAIDGINRRYGQTLISVGPWTPPPGDHIGGKISYTRIPRAEDFY